MDAVLLMSFLLAIFNSIQLLTIHTDHSALDVSRHAVQHALYRLQAMDVKPSDLFQTKCLHHLMQ